VRVKYSPDVKSNRSKKTKEVITDVTETDYWRSRAKEIGEERNKELHL
jgi:hypothetical protein